LRDRVDHDDTGDPEHVNGGERQEQDRGHGLSSTLVGPVGVERRYGRCMTETGDPGKYAPSPWEWVRTQVEEYERSGGRRANTLGDTGLPVIIVTTTGNKSGTVRKTPLMRVEHDGEYALVASMGGAPKHPVWYYNLKAAPDEVVIQDGPEPFAVDVRELAGDERAVWWDRAVAAYPPYAEYQTRTDRLIPVFVATRRA
jgi:deazaflavin-dependent oxidoreductase (nitroreductase family)